MVHLACITSIIDAHKRIAPANKRLQFNIRDTYNKSSTDWYRSDAIDFVLILDKLIAMLTGEIQCKMVLFETLLCLKSLICFSEMLTFLS